MKMYVSHTLKPTWRPQVNMKPPKKMQTLSSNTVKEEMQERVHGKDWEKENEDEDGKTKQMCYRSHSTRGIVNSGKAAHSLLLLNASYISLLFSIPTASALSEEFIRLSFFVFQIISVSSDHPSRSSELSSE